LDSDLDSLLDDLESPLELEELDSPPPPPELSGALLEDELSDDVELGAADEALLEAAPDALELAADAAEEAAEEEAWLTVLATVVATT